jgi:hypothetical protein
MVGESDSLFQYAVETFARSFEVSELAADPVAIHSVGLLDALFQTTRKRAILTNPKDKGNTGMRVARSGTDNVANRFEKNVR